MISYFNKWAKKYNKSVLQGLLFKPTHKLALFLLSRLSCEKPRLFLLDVGCGTGLFLSQTIKYFPSWLLVGIDNASAMIKIARKTKPDLKKVNFLKATANKIPFNANSFHFIVCLHSFHHYQNKPKCIKEMLRVLKPEGYLIIVDGSVDTWWGKLLFKNTIEKIEKNTEHYSIQQFNSVFKSRGVKNIFVFVKHGLIPCTVVIVKKP